MFNTKLAAIILAFVGYANSAQATIPDNMFQIIDHGFKSTQEYRSEICKTYNYQGAYCGEPDQETIQEAKNFGRRQELLSNLDELGFNHTIANNTILMMVADNNVVTLSEVKIMAYEITYHIEKYGLESDPEASSSSIFVSILESLRTNQK